MGYILVVQYSGYETSVEEFVTLDDLKKYIKDHSNVIQQKFWIAKVIANEFTLIENLGVKKCH